MKNIVQHRRGFTIVELLIVIVVIAILATVSVVAYNGIQVRAKNAQQKDAATKYVKLLQLYKAQYGAYPTQYGCLGENNIDSDNDSVPDCGDDGSRSYNATLNTELKKVGTTPNIVTDRILGTDGVNRAGMFYEASYGGSIVYFVRGSTSDCTVASSYNGSRGESVWCRVLLQ